MATYFMILGLHHGRVCACLDHNDRLESLTTYSRYNPLFEEVETASVLSIGILAKKKSYQGPGSKRGDDSYRSKFGTIILYIHVNF